jgi:4-hydroxybenzoate polyprenyltransferase
MAFNRYLDRSFDAKNPRTAIREIPAGLFQKKAL